MGERDMNLKCRSEGQVIGIRNNQHELKTLARYWDAVASGEKKFEVRRNDRAFQTGDTLLLLRYEDDQINRTYGVSSGALIRRITYLLQGGQFGIDPGYCVLGLGTP